MMQMINKVRDRKGFTLIELLIVVAIIGILAAIAIPAFLGQQKKAKAKALESSCSGIAKQAGVMLNSVSTLEPVILSANPATKLCFAHISRTMVDSVGDGVPDMLVCEAKYRDIFTATGQSTYFDTTLPTDIDETFGGAIVAENCGATMAAGATMEASAAAAVGIGASPTGGLGRVSPYAAGRCIVGTIASAGAAATVYKDDETFEGICTVETDSAGTAMRVVLVDDDGQSGTTGEVKVYPALSGD